MRGLIDMNDRDRALTSARAVADQQLTLVNDTLDKTVDEARKLLATNGVTDTWAMLGARLAKELDCTTKHQQFAAEVAIAAAIRLAQKA